ncbi:MAG TPA: hypothetical protein VNZ49_03495 [Bacteroidia bacterium]|nr:hypothetical protein [Bacteroidia bacterium]
MKKTATYILLAIVFISVVSSSCRARDCHGRKKTVKTNMGGWL